MYPSILIFYEIQLSCFLCKIISYNLKHIYIKYLCIRCNYFFFNLYVFNNDILWDEKAALGIFLWKKLSLKKRLHHRCFPVSFCRNVILRHINAFLPKVLVAVLWNVIILNCLFVWTAYAIWIKIWANIGP